MVKKCAIKGGCVNNNIIWMPHAGHFICSSRCQFRLNTYVNGYIISTVGEYVPSTRTYSDEADDKFEKIGFDRLYETMVFKAKKSNFKCCPYEMVDPTGIEMAGYNEASDAYKGHLKLVNKYAKAKD